MEIVEKNSSIRQIEDSKCCYRRISGNAVRLIWEITGRCNLKCHHCFANVSTINDSDKKELSTEEALNIISQIRYAGIRKVMITGGEPFVRKDLMTILSAIRDAGEDIVIDITTNGILLNSDIIQSMKRLSIDELSISFDGTSGVYNYVRGTTPVIYDKLLDNIRTLIESNIKVDAILVLTNETASSLYETICLASEIGFSSLSISNLMTLPHSSFDYDKLSLTDNELKFYLDRIADYQKEFKDKLIIRTVGFSRCMGENCKNRSIIAIDRNGFYTHCLNYYTDDDCRYDSRKNKLKDVMSMINERKCVP